ncbi:MAG: aminotransferase class V-fold PLP-dependent enzyme [Labilithrix sp.]|nr:aminotransferase class V-fold PLP-dependent enzyme [Labilithrix sp.]
MNTGRRSFLAYLATSVPALNVLGCARPAAPVEVRHVPADLGTWDGVRRQFPLDPSWIHLAGFLLASHPQPVRDAIERHRRGLDENPALYLHEQEHAGEANVREAAARYMGVDPAEIALTDSTTMGLGTLYQGLPLASGQEILTTTHDHFSTHESLRLSAERAGATVRKIPLYDEPALATPAAMVDAIARAITKATRVVAITWVHSGTGVKTPVRAIADAVAKANAGREERDRAFLCVDGVHGFGVESVPVGELGCDFFVAGCHKWLFGPRGTGVVWGRKDLWPLVRPSIPAFTAEAWTPWLKGSPPAAASAAVMTPGGFHSFEHRWALDAAFAFHQSIGVGRVAARIRELNRQCKEGLAAMKHVVLHTPRGDEPSAGIVTFEVAGLAPKAVVERLAANKIMASTTPYATSYARVAPGLLNSPTEVDAVLRRIRELASV